MSKTITSHRYLLDAGVFIQAHRAHYGLDFCPPYWNALLHFHGNGRVLSIARIKGELIRGKKNPSKKEKAEGIDKPDDGLVAWASKSAPKSLFVSEDETDVIRAFGELVNLVDTAGVNFTPEAKFEFNDGNDGWLIAYAKAFGLTVVTHEGSEPMRRSRVKIPDLCKTAGVRCVTPFGMLRELGMRFSDFTVENAPASPETEESDDMPEDDEDSLED